MVAALSLDQLPHLRKAAIYLATMVYQLDVFLSWGLQANNQQ